jgi:hypothetical protein
MVAKMLKIAYNSSMKFEKDLKMKAQFAALPIRLQSAMLKELRTIHAQSRADLKAGKELLKADRAAAKAAKAAALLEKQQARALKQEQAILKAQLRLEKLLAKQAAPVGVKALKARL